MWIARSSTFHHVSPGRESRLDHSRGYAMFVTRRRAVIPQTETTAADHFFTLSVLCPNVPERRDEKSRPTRFTCDTTVNRFWSGIFLFTCRSRVRNSAFSRFIFSVYAYFIKTISSSSAFNSHDTYDRIINNTVFLESIVTHWVNDSYLFIASLSFILYKCSKQIFFSWLEPCTLPTLPIGDKL